MTCFFMDRFESKMTPRFLAESAMGMLWEPRVIKSGREMAEGFKEDEKGMWRASVLSSLSLSWFSVIHVFLSVHAPSSLVRLVTSMRGADFWSCVSSTKSWWFTEWLAISERGVMYKTKRRIWWSIMSKATKRSNKRRTEMFSSEENIIYNK